MSKHLWTSVDFCPSFDKKKKREKININTCLMLWPELKYLFLCPAGLPKIRPQTDVARGDQVPPQEVEVLQIDGGVCASRAAQGQAVWISWQPLVTLPSDHLGPFLCLIYTHTHICTMHQWELVVTVEMAGVGRATDASFSMFVSLCVFHLPTSLHPSLPPFVIPPSPPSVSSYLTYFLSSIPFCFPPFLLYFYLPHVTRLSFIRTIMFRPAGSSHSSPHSYPRPPALSHMLALTSTIALDQRWSFFFYTSHSRWEMNGSSGTNNSQGAICGATVVQRHQRDQQKWTSACGMDGFLYSGKLTC